MIERYTCRKILVFFEKGKALIKRFSTIFNFFLANLALMNKNQSNKIQILMLVWKMLTVQVNQSKIQDEYFSVSLDAFYHQ